MSFSSTTNTFGSDLVSECFGFGCGFGGTSGSEPATYFSYISNLNSSVNEEATFVLSVDSVFLVPSGSGGDSKVIESFLMSVSFFGS